jgi:hypothetical protein
MTLRMTSPMFGVVPVVGGDGIELLERPWLSADGGRGASRRPSSFDVFAELLDNGNERVETRSKAADLRMGGVFMGQVRYLSERAY